MSVVQQELLWLLYDLGHLDKYPMALGKIVIIIWFQLEFKWDLEEVLNVESFLKLIFFKVQAFMRQALQKKKV